MEFQHGDIWIGVFYSHGDQETDRVTRTFTQQLVAGPEAVFPLLCSVREVEWADGWDPVLVATYSGVAELDCVFVTPAASNQAIWFITRHERENGVVEMLKITPKVTACKLTILVRTSPRGSEAVITYSHTSLWPGRRRLCRVIHRGILRGVHEGLGEAPELLFGSWQGVEGRLLMWFLVVFDKLVMPATFRSLKSKQACARTSPLIEADWRIDQASSSWRYAR